MFLGGSLARPIREDFLEALAIEGKLGSSVLSHLFRDFEPVHGHGYKDTLPATVLKTFSCIPTLSQRARKGGAPAPGD